MNRNGLILAPAIDPQLLAEISTDIFLSDVDVAELQIQLARGLISGPVYLEQMLYLRDLARTLAAQQIRSMYFFDSSGGAIH